MPRPEDDREYLLKVMMDHLGWDRLKATTWFGAANPLLGNVSPDFLLRSGRGPKLLKFIQGIVTAGSECLHF